MPFIPVPNAARVAVRATLFGQDVINVLHFTRSGGYDAAALAQLGEGVRDAYEAGVQPNLSLDLVYQDVTVRSLDVQDGVQVVVPWDGTGAGGNVGGSVPGNVAFVLTHRTAFIGRSRRGRTYLAGFPEGLVTGNLLDSTVASDLADAFNTMRTGLGAAGFFFAVVSYVSNGVPRTEGLTTAVDLTVARDTRVDSQRGRLS